MNKTISYSNYFKFKTRIIHIPSSDNMMGMDPYPKYHRRATELEEVMEYSNKVKSTDDGFRKDAGSGLWLKNRDGSIPTEEIIGQFEIIALEPPYWYYDEESYMRWWQMNIDRQAFLKSAFMQSPLPQVKVNADQDELLPVVHYYKEVPDWTTRTFYKNKIQDWPKLKGVTFYDKNLAPHMATSTAETTTTDTTSAGGPGGY